MANLPGQITPTVEVRPVPNAYLHTKTTPQDFGAGVGQALQQVGGAVGEIARSERMLAVSAAADDADLKTATKMGELQQEFFQKYRGEDAVKVLPEHIKDLEFVREEGKKTLKDPLAQRLYESQTRRRAEGMINTAQSHAREQLDMWYKNTSDLKHKDVVHQAASLYTDPAKLSELIHGDVAKRSLYFGGVLGIKGDDLNAKTHADIVEVLESSLNGALATNTATGAKQGKALLDADVPGVGKVRDVIGGKRAEAWEAQFKKNLASTTAVTLSVELMDKYGANTVAGNKDLRNRFKSGELDADTYLAAQNQYNHLQSQQHVAVEQAKADHFDNAYTFFAKQAGHSVEQFEALNPKLWNSLTGMEQDRLRSVQDSKAKENSPKSLAQRQALAEAYDQLDQDPQKYDGAEGSKRFVNDWVDKLYPRDFDTLQNFLGHRGMAAEKMPAGYREIANSGLGMITKSMGLDGKAKKDWTEPELDVMENARQDLRSYILQYAKKHNGAMPPRTTPDGNEGWQRIVDQYTIIGASPGTFGYWLGGREKTRAQAAAEGVEWEPMIPLNLITEFEESFKRAPENPMGLPPTKEQTQAAVKAWIDAHNATSLVERATPERVRASKAVE